MTLTHGNLVKDFLLKLSTTIGTRFVNWSGITLSVEQTGKHVIGCFIDIGVKLDRKLDVWIIFSEKKYCDYEKCPRGSVEWNSYGNYKMIRVHWRNLKKKKKEKDLVEETTFKLIQVELYWNWSGNHFFLFGKRWFCLRVIHFYKFSNFIHFNLIWQERGFLAQPTGNSAWLTSARKYRLTLGCKTTLVHNVGVSFGRYDCQFFTSFSAKHFDINIIGRSRTKLSLIQNVYIWCWYLSVKLIKKKCM